MPPPESDDAASAVPDAASAVPDPQSRRIRLDIAYDGGAFSGWSKQPGLRTVQGELEAALATVFSRHGPVPFLVVAGRTDAGVHALGQVAHLDLTAEQVASLERPHRGPTKGRRLAPIATLVRRLNGIAGMSSDVYVSSAAVAPPGFDARFSAIWRRYRYRIADASAPRNPLERGYTLWYPSRLDALAMHHGAQSLLGLHDWASYCKPRDIGTTIRTLQGFQWVRRADGVLEASLQADAFCHSMVRALVGASIAVGEGNLAASDLTVLRDRLERTNRFKVAPAKGLALVEIGYPPDGELADRATQTRAIRPPLVASDLDRPV